MIPEMNFVILYKGAGGEFAERLALRAVIDLKQTRTHMALRASSEYLGANLESVRIDFDDKPSSFMLHDLRVVSPNGEHLYLWNGEPDQLIGVGFEAVKTVSGVQINCLNDDPQLPVVFDAPLPEWVSISIVVSAAEEHFSFAEKLAALISNQEGLQHEFTQRLRSLDGSLADFGAAGDDVDQALLELRNAALAQFSLTDQRLGEVEQTLKQSVESLRALDFQSSELRQFIQVVADRSSVKSIEALNQFSDDLQKKIARAAATDLVAAFDARVEKLGFAVAVEGVLVRLDDQSHMLREQLHTAKDVGLIRERLIEIEQAIPQQIASAASGVVEALDVTLERLEFSKAVAALSQQINYQTRLLSEQQYAARDAVSMRERLIEAERDRTEALVAKELAVEEVQSKIDELEGAKEALLTFRRSTSWRLTRPMRAIKELIRPAGKS